MSPNLYREMCPPHRHDTKSGFAAVERERERDEEKRDHNTNSLEGNF